jgi:hypothetical protein
MAKPLARGLFNLSRWNTLGGAFLFFLFFGLSGEARQEYKRICWVIVARLGIKPSAPKPQGSTGYVHLVIFPGCAQ